MSSSFEKHPCIYTHTKIYLLYIISYLSIYYYIYYILEQTIKLCVKILHHRRTHPSDLIRLFPDTTLAGLNLLSHQVWQVFPKNKPVMPMVALQLEVVLIQPLVKKAMV